MKKKHVFFLFLACFAFVQCKKSAESVDEGYAAPVFPETKEITVECLNDSFIFDIGGIDQLDTLLICSGKTDINDYVFHLFSKNSGAYIKSFGTIGQGPGEILWPVMGYSTDQKEDKLHRIGADGSGGQRFQRVCRHGAVGPVRPAGRKDRRRP